MAGIKETFSKGLTTINVKTNNFMEETKIKTHIGTLETECRTLYTKAGEMLFQQWKSGNIVMDDFQGILAEVDQKLQQIETEKENIQNLKKIESDILGAKPQPVPNAVSQIFCAQCGATNNSNYKFCCKCGSLLVK